MIIIRNNQAVHEGKESISSNYLKSEATLVLLSIQIKIQTFSWAAAPDPVQLELRRAKETQIHPTEELITGQEE